MCDRILCPMKAAIRRYCNEGHDVVSAQDMYTALKERPVNGTTATVCAIQEQCATLEISKIPNYSNLHNFKFTHKGLRVWRAFNVGPGKFIPWNDIVICPQTKTNLLDEIPFFPTTARRFALREQSKAEVNEDKLFQCPETSSTEEFQREAKLPTFKVKMLREICTHFDVPFRSRDTKAVLVTKVKEMVSECSCNTQP